MTPADIERMALEAAIEEPGMFYPRWVATGVALARFASLVRAAALEEAAQTAEYWPRADSWVADEIADRIRSLAKEQQK